MKYYRDPNTDEVWAFEADGSQDHIIDPRLVPLTVAEIEEHLNPPEVVYVPQQVTRAQGKAALIQSGLWQVVLDYVTSIEDDTERALAEVALHDATHYQRHSPFLNACAEALGITEDQMDELFIQASKIRL